jgi:DNA-binding NarL/FixJ family response regulator
MRSSGCASGTAKAMALGAHGYLLKSASPQQVLEAVRAVAQGHRTWTRTDHRRLSGYSASAEPHSAGETPLTPREAEVLIALTEGKTNKEISEQLHISTETVKEHVQHVLRKLGVADRTQAAVWAVRQGLV